MSDVVIQPSPEVRYIATIEILDGPDETFGVASDETIGLVKTLFPSLD